MLMEEEWLSKDYTVMDLINKIKELKKVSFYTEYLVFVKQHFRISVRAT